MIPRDIQAQHIEKAIEYINKNGVPKSRESYRYDLVFNGQKYPPKYTISIAHKIAVGVEWPSDHFIATEARDYFLHHGYEIQTRPHTRPDIVSEIHESNYPEGKENYKLHRRRERDPSFAKKIKQQRLQQIGELRCDVCGFSFSNKYGHLGTGFIEAHHTIPISKLKSGTKTKTKDIALVCSNCHRMLHAGDKLLSVKELRDIISTNGSK